MPHRKLPAPFAMRRRVVTVLLGLGSTSALAQGAEPPAGGGLASDPSPYYIGGSQAFTHDSNAFGIPFGPSDNYSSTSLLAGFEQPFSRQRVFGTARVSANRYQDQTQLNNTSYGLVAGLDWATIWKMSGNVAATLDQRLAPPAATVAAPTATRNLEKRQGVSGLARWGGDSLITVEGRLGYSTLDYSAPQNVSSESKNEFGSLGVFYRPGPLLRVGTAVRLERTRTPQAIRLADGSFESNEIRSRTLDLIGDYNNGNNITASGRLGYTRQTNSGLDDADFSGLTGNLNLGYRVTGKIAVNVGASRDAGFNATNRSFAPIVMQTSAASAPVSTSASPYENNQVTNTFTMGATYAATSKIGLSAGARYARARVITSSAVVTSGRQARPDVVDETRGASLGATYAFSRAWTFACNLARDRREVSGANSYGYTDDVASCSAQFVWR